MEVLVLTDDEAEWRLLADALGLAFPAASLHRIGEVEIEARRFPAADCAVAAERVGAHSGLEALRLLRAAGFAGGAVLVAEATPAELVARARPLGAACVERGRVAIALGDAVLEQSRLDPDSIPARELRRVQRLVAVGEVAARFQHDVNNPLTALLAELQLLEAEPLGEGQRDSVTRMIDLCRRVVAMVRRLDAVRPANDGTVDGGASGNDAGGAGTGAPPAG